MIRPPALISPPAVVKLAAVTAPAAVRAPTVAVPVTDNCADDRSAVILAELAVNPLGDSNPPALCTRVVAVSVAVVITPVDASDAAVTAPPDEIDAAVTAPAVLKSPEDMEDVTRITLADSVPETTSLPLLLTVPTTKVVAVTGPDEETPAAVKVPTTDAGPTVTGPDALSDPAASKLVILALPAVTAPVPACTPPTVIVPDAARVVPVIGPALLTDAPVNAPFELSEDAVRAPENVPEPTTTELAVMVPPVEMLPAVSVPVTLADAADRPLDALRDCTAASEVMTALPAVSAPLACKLVAEIDCTLNEDDTVKEEKVAPLAVITPLVVTDPVVATPAV